ncbi:hypothetical protein HYW75_03565 [Candidatus Pacearchaeota archaeon]|nr:hypothetical protein [Candidatus Pacearchaeota archaeon]
MREYPQLYKSLGAKSTDFIDNLIAELKNYGSIEDINKQILAQIDDNQLHRLLKRILSLRNSNKEKYPDLLMRMVAIMLRLQEVKFELDMIQRIFNLFNEEELRGMGNSLNVLKGCINVGCIEYDKVQTYAAPDIMKVTWRVKRRNPQNYTGEKVPGLLNTLEEELDITGKKDIFYQCRIFYTNKVKGNSDFSSKSARVIVASLLYFFCKKSRVAFTQEEIADHLKISRAQIVHCIKLIQKVED